MKIVFFSSNRLEVELLGQTLAEAGIQCHVRDGIRLVEEAPRLPETELWIQNDNDTHRAFMLFVERDVGFAKRETPSYGFDDLFREAEPLKPELAA